MGRHRTVIENFCCEHCGQELPHVRSDRVMRFCGRSCYQNSRNRPPTQICPQCGDAFTQRRKNGQSPIHCSRRCEAKSRITAISHTCSVCGVTFVRVKSMSPLYCSHKCQGKTLEKNVAKTCEWCGKEYLCKPSTSQDRRFCSRDCIRSKRGESRPERLIREALEDLAIPFIQEYKIGRYRIDFFLPDSSIAVEADGTFWHTNPVGRLRDERRDAVVLTKGVRTIRITEAELNKARSVADLVYSRLVPHLNAA